MKNGKALSVKDLNALLDTMKKRLVVANQSEQTIINYVRSVEYLCKHTGKHPLEPPKLLIIEVLELVYGVKPGICKHCGGKMILVKSKARPRASPKVA